MRSRPPSGAIRLSTLLSVSLCAAITAALGVSGRLTWTKLTPDSRPIESQGGRLRLCVEASTDASVDLHIQDCASAESLWVSTFENPVYVRFACNDTVLVTKEGSLSAPTRAFDVRSGKAIPPP